MTAILITLTTCGCITNVATASRQMFAFARDGGLPFSTFLSHVSVCSQLKHNDQLDSCRDQVRPGWDIPLNSVLVSFAVAILLSLINIGSTVAFNSIASLGTCALLSSYIISISCMFLKRWRNEPLLPSRFNLGRAGIWVNGIAVVYLSVATIFSFFPSFPNPTPDLMNWNILIYGVVVVFSLVYFVIQGKKVYVGPVEYINRNM